MRRPLLIAALLSALPALLWAAGAAALSLELPIDCPANGLCVIQNYVDRTQSGDPRDYACGYLTYPEHNGTDFRVSQRDMERGVPVRAAADGVVKGFRDGMPDVSVKKIDRQKIHGREAGNGVRIEHEDGFVTQYSHLRKGSVRVRPGQKVAAGQIIGLVGMSGNTEFPHLDFAVRKDGQTVCPFTGPAESAACDAEQHPLWSPAARASPALAYTPTGILDLGFAEATPETGEEPTSLPRATALPASAKAIVFWVALFGVQAGDVQTLQVVGPDGRIVSRVSQPVQKNQAQRIAFVGRRLGDAPPWPTGEYRGEYTLVRPGPAGNSVLLKASATLLVQ